MSSKSTSRHGSSAQPSFISMGGKLVNDEESEYQQPIKLINLIFLPFNALFQLAVLICVLVKCTVGSVQAIYPFVTCRDYDLHIVFKCLKFLYDYVVNVIYGIDTFLHIVHRQVSDEAMKREHLPKPAYLLAIDILSMVPVYRMLSEVQCPESRVWPGIICFRQYLTIYRIFEYFSLKVTHSLWNLAAGFILVLLISVASMASFLLMVTFDGLCTNCRDNIYDWRIDIIHKYPSMSEGQNTYIFGAMYAMCMFVNKIVIDLKAHSYGGFVLCIIALILAYTFSVFIVVPKLFAEALLRMRPIALFHPHVVRIIEETKRRNQSPTAYRSVEEFYSLVWNKYKGISNLPAIIDTLPRYLKVDIREDLFWPVFYHSPTFRNTSVSYKRWLSNHMTVDYKLPGERFFAGAHCYTNLYYIKSGIVQFISADDSMSPLLSVTGGTLLGDVSFYVPPFQRTVTVRCLTYCEVFVTSREKILRSLHMFPQDRVNIMKLARKKIKHGRSLINCKQIGGHLNRSDDEGIAWLKRRWWEIANIITRWNNSQSQSGKRELPPEETPHHCSKYIGQLVMCTEMQLQRKSMFAKVKFPWVLLPNSAFGVMWHRIVLITVFSALIFYPPNLSRNTIPVWFKCFQFYVDFIYIVDIFVSLMTSMDTKMNKTVTFTSTAIARSKTLFFLLDIISTAWVDHFISMIGLSKFHQPCQYNRLIKTYILLTGDFRNKWNPKKDPLTSACVEILLLQCFFVYVLGYFIYLMNRFIPYMTTEYFFGSNVCPHNYENKCDQDNFGVINVMLGYILEITLSNTSPSTYFDICLAAFIIFSTFTFQTYARCKYMACLYFKRRNKTNYHHFVYTTKEYYVHNNIHPDLLKRLERYFECHWRYFSGVDVMNPNILKDEPFDIFSKCHGDVAETVIGSSKVFLGADKALIKELAYKASFLILPKYSALCLFGVNTKSVSWLVNGVLRCEYHDEFGELIKTYPTNTQILSLSSVFLGKIAFRSYIAESECEILNIENADFFNIIKRYPAEWSYIQTCIEEVRPRFEINFQKYVRDYRDYQKKLRERVFHARQSVISKLKITEDKTPSYTNFSFQFHLLDQPESRFIIYWMLFRVVFVILKIISAALQGGSGAHYKPYLRYTEILCDVVSFIDIGLKLFFPYYDEKGIIIKDTRLCMWHYVSRGFAMDLIGAVPETVLLQSLLAIRLTENAQEILNTALTFCHLYLLMGYFDYYMDAPSRDATFLTILKWQLVTMLLLIGTGSFFVNKCIEFHWDHGSKLIWMKRIDGCWIPSYVQLDKFPTISQLHMTFAKGLTLAQCSLFRTNSGMFLIKNDSYLVAALVIFLGFLFWFTTGYYQTLLILKFRGNTVYQYGVQKLLYFLKDERVEREIVDRAIRHFTYNWSRTKGLDVENLMNVRVGVVFRQDVNYYFYKKTLAAMDSMLKGGEAFLRQMSNIIFINYFMADEDILREKDLVPYVYIVHRGSVVVSQDGNKLAIINKGGLFGQLDSSVSRPIRVTVKAAENCDVLKITAKQFQDILTDDIKKNIDDNPESANDYLSLKKFVPENPYNTIEYLLRGNTIIKLPWMLEPMEIHSNVWYYCWLYFVWLCVTTVAVAISLILHMIPKGTMFGTLWALAGLDLVFVMNFIAEFYTMETVVRNHKCVNEYIRWKKLAQWGFYCDVVSLIVPMVGSFLQIWQLHLFRLLHLRSFFDFHKHFCRNFQDTVSPILLKFIILLMLLHAMTCGWIYVACRSYEDEFYPTSINAYEIPAHINMTINYDQWVHPHTRPGGCAFLHTTEKSSTGLTVLHFVVPKNWRADYLVAFTFIIISHTRTNIDFIVDLTLPETYYRMFVDIILYFIEIWISSVIISAVYTRFRELYQYDFQVLNLYTYLKNNGLSKAMLNSVLRYSKMLWTRQKGNWLPEMAQRGPLCLREDLFSSLYMHHMETPTLFHLLPPYFLRQLVVRLRRIVVFPGKFVAEEGDIWPKMYFIHEGEVEKWYTDDKGDSRIISVLTQNGYFGLIPGLFPDIPYQFSYYTRTVVDLVYLLHNDWRDLLDGYPDVKTKLYEAAKHLKKDLIT